ncbi:LysR family transcriptional regulator [Tabrizicola oligotrophica]|uniref:LysR family transcriptional regulator n=1 Tax=Tabrizicola oligotrophica TaxID=2710650 RepID=A0A6M0QUD7_9RHOB|nr:LysR family transcriptional regulator [Tabrizicola oligotrophica]NEY90611.1 LysR family transcriptional regulator [Tabrizicola oligotrophica]
MNSFHPQSLADVDLRLLRVFNAIVQANGFSAAEEPLGMSQATISVHMRNLEDRLGLRLCERGRGGFYLTEAGRQVHSAMLDLFGSLQRFHGAVADARGELTGDLNFGTVDAMATNGVLKLGQAIAAFQARAPRVRLYIDIAAPQDLARGVLTGRYQLALLPAEQPPANTEAVELFRERQNLYCGQRHPLFAAREADLTDDVLAAHPFAGRSYMAEAARCGIAFDRRAVAAHMEGTLILLQSGAYTGFLPDHFAAPEVAAGRLRALAPGRVTFDDLFLLIHPRNRLTRAAELLVTTIVETCRDSAGRPPG